VGSSALEARLRAAIRSIDGHRDAWAVFEDAPLLAAVVEALADGLVPYRATKVVAVESRGFLLGGAVAARLGLGFVAVRKPGSLFPGDKAAVTTAPDYRGNRTELRMLTRAVGPGDRVAMVDDWIEVGAQALAVRELVESRGGEFLGLATMVDQASRAVAGAVPVLVGLVNGSTLDDG
jgi:adenine phosphoribosyltransferase